MRPTKEAFQAAKTLAETEGYDYIVFDKARKDCIIYSVSRTSDAGAIIGYPVFVIVDNNLSARFAGYKEVWDW